MRAAGGGQLPGAGPHEAAAGQEIRLSPGQRPVPGDRRLYGPVYRQRADLPAPQAEPAVRRCGGRPCRGGYRIGKRKGDEADRIWQEVVNELAASEEGEKVNALSIESNIHGLIDTLDVFDQETTSSDDAGDAQ